MLRVRIFWGRKAAAAAVSAPIVNVPALHTQRARWTLDNTSRGTPKTLIGDSILPVGAATRITVPQVPQTYLNTSQGTALALQIVVAPFVTPLTIQSARSYWQPADSSKATAKTLTADSVVPVANYPYLSPDRIRVVGDTTRGTITTLFPGVAPPGTSLHQSPPRPLWQPEDSSIGLAKVAYSDSRLPVFNPPQFQLDRRRPVTADSQSAYGLFYPVAEVPSGKTIQLVPLRFWWQPADSSFSIPPDRIPDQIIIPSGPIEQYAVGGGGKHLNLNDLEVFRYVDKRMKEGVEVEEILRELRKEKVPEPAKPIPGRRVVLEKPKLPATIAPESLRMLNEARELSRDARELEQVIRLSIQQEFLALSQEQEAAHTLRNRKKAALLLLIAGTM